jgi:hypothetical protein
MKLLVIFLILTLGVQPLQAGPCDMNAEEGQAPAHHMDMSDQSGHDCCDPEPDDRQEGCEGGMQCCPCFVSVFAVHTVVRISPAWERVYLSDLPRGMVPPSHSSPPFRPPIS